MSNTHYKESKKQLNLFLEAWKDHDVQKMFDVCQNTWRLNHNVEYLSNRVTHPLDEFRIMARAQSAPVVIDYKVMIKIEGLSAVVRIRMVCENTEGKPDTDGRYGVNPNSIRNVDLKKVD